MSHTVMRSLSEIGWTVYRVRTASSHYHLGVFEGGMGKRRCAVLRGMSGGLGRAVDLQDSAPLIGGVSLFEVPPSGWIGKQLEIGTATTSPIQAVDEESDRTVITSITSGASLAPSGPRAPAGEVTAWRAPPPAQEASPWAPYPEDYVERVEVAAGLLRAAYQKKSLLEDLRDQRELLERFELGLSECFLMLRAIGARMADQRRGD